MTAMRARSHRRLPNLATGFAMLSLDPTPRLRRLRRELNQRQPMTDAWSATAEAMRQAVQTVAVEQRPRN